MNPEKLNPTRRWGRAETIEVSQLLLCGLFVGVVVRWLALSAPVLPVNATAAEPTVKAPGLAVPAIPAKAGGDPASEQR